MKVGGRKEGRRRDKSSELMEEVRKRKQRSREKRGRRKEDKEDVSKEDKGGRKAVQRKFAVLGLSNRGNGKTLE